MDETDDELVSVMALDVREECELPGELSLEHYAYGYWLEKVDDTKRQETYDVVNIIQTGQDILKESVTSIVRWVNPWNRSLTSLWNAKRECARMILAVSRMELKIDSCIAQGNLPKTKHRSETIYSNVLDMQEMCVEIPKEENKVNKMSKQRCFYWDSLKGQCKKGRSCKRIHSLDKEGMLCYRCGATLWNLPTVSSRYVTRMTV